MAEDFKKLRRTVRKLVAMDFQKQWQFRLELPEEPTDFDLFVKDISFGTHEAITEEDTCGGVSMCWPTGVELVKLTATMRDDSKGTVSTFIDNWIRKAVHADGTVGLPFGLDGYVKTVKRYIVTDTSEILAEEWEMYPKTRGDVSQSRESGEFLEFPVVFVMFGTQTLKE